MTRVGIELMTLNHQRASLKLQTMTSLKGQGPKFTVILKINGIQY